MKQEKAPGLDNVCGEYLKTAEANITPFLTLLFKKIYDSSCFPSDWCKTIIMPLFKRGMKRIQTIIGDWGISLLSIVSKVFTATLNNQLYNWTEKEGKIRKEHAGFQKHYSKTDHIFTLTSIIDYKKAFDTVNRQNMRNSA